MIGAKVTRHRWTPMTGGITCCLQVSCEEETWGVSVQDPLRGVSRHSVLLSLKHEISCRSNSFRLKYFLLSLCNVERNLWDPCLPSLAVVKCKGEKVTGCSTEEDQFFLYSLYPHPSHNVRSGLKSLRRELIPTFPVGTFYVFLDRLSPSTVLYSSDLLYRPLSTSPSL